MPSGHGNVRLRVAGADEMCFTSATSPEDLRAAALQRAMAIAVAGTRSA